MINKVIIYEKLNLFTVCHSIIARFYFKELVFVNYSYFLKNICSQIVKHLGFKQIHFVKSLDSGLQARHGQMVVNITNEIITD